MRFGLVKRNSFLLSLVFVAGFHSCKTDPAIGESISFKFPEQGQMVSIGESIRVKLDVPVGQTLKSAKYLLDGVEIAANTATDSLMIPTKDFSVGYKLITAIADLGTHRDTLTVNVVMKPGKKPALYSYKVQKVFPHDTSSYTQGLEYHNGRFLESTGLIGSSTLRWVNLQSGKALQETKIDPKFFGEGSTLVDDKIIMLTWQNNLGLVFNANTLQQEASFPYQDSREGWGLCFDGTRLIKSDGSNKLYFLNKDSFKEEGAVEVYDNDGPVNSLNELEYVDGKIYANVYMKDYLVVIDPKTGIVEKKIDLTGLLANGYTRNANDLNIDVLNGIAWDKAGKRLFVTGKKWPKLFEIRLVPQ